MKGVVLAAGKGVRMRQLTEDIPKPLLPIANKPMLQYTLEAFKNAAVTEILIVVAYLKEQIEDFFGNGEKFGVHIQYAVEQKLLGTGEAAMLAEEFAADQPFLLAFSDILTPQKNFAHLIQDFLQHGPDAILSVYRVDDPCTGAAVYVKDGLITKIIEKPEKGTSTTNYNNAGIFILAPGIFEALKKIRPSPRGEIELTDAIQIMIENKVALRAFELEGFWSNISSPEDLLEANKLMIQSLQKRSRYPVNENIAIIGKNCSIQESEIGDNVSIADEVSIGKGSSISSAIICENVKIGSRVYIENAFIKKNTSIPDGEILRGKKDCILIVG